MGLRCGAWLKSLLLHPATSAPARNKVWAELVRRARTGTPAWVIGLTGVAMPGLRRAVAALSSAYRGDVEDLQTEVLTGLDRIGWPRGCAGPPARRAGPRLRLAA